MKFTKQQLSDWKAYERVRQSGKFNMICDHRARSATKLGDERYIFVMHNYSELKESNNTKSNS